MGLSKCAPFIDILTGLLGTHDLQRSHAFVAMPAQVGSTDQYSPEEARWLWRKKGKIPNDLRSTVAPIQQ